MEVYSALLAKQFMVLNLAINQPVVIWTYSTHTEAFLATLTVE